MPTYSRTTWVDGVTSANAATLNNIEDKVVALDAGSGFVSMEDPDFVGADDDATLSNILTYAAAQTYRPAVRLTNRAYTFNTGGRAPFEGMRIWGAVPGYQNPERGSGAAGQGTKVTLNFSGGWFNATTSNVFQVSFGQLAFRGNSSASVLTNSGSGSWYCLHMRDIFSSNLLSVLGTQATKLLITAAQFDGAWEINNCYDGAFHLGGSDNTLWPAGMLLDSAVAFAGSGQFHLWCDYLDKTAIGPLYITCEQSWGGIKVTGPTSPNSGNSNAGIVSFLPGLKVEGRNPGQPCYGSLVRVEGGQLDVPYGWFGYAMSSPSSMGHSPTDAAAVDVLGGVVDLHGCRYDRATGVGEAVPFVNVAAGAEAWVTRVKLASRGGTWSGRPIVKNSGGSINYDSSVTVV